jgi:hypothetical protein
VSLLEREGFEWAADDDQRWGIGHAACRDADLDVFFPRFPGRFSSTVRLPCSGRATKAGGRVSSDSRPLTIRKTC